MLLFDVNAPFDAPLRLKERQQRIEHEEALAYMRSDEFQRLMAPIVLKAYEAVRSKQ
jgi:hypothetical protein